MNLYKAIVQIEVFYLGDDVPTKTDIERHVFEEAVINNFEIVSVGQVVSEAITVDGIEGRTMQLLLLESGT